MATDHIAVIDLETTGLSPWRHDRVIEIGIVVISPDGSIHSEYETLVNPIRDIGPTGIHQIAAGDVLGAPIFADVAGDVLRILSDVSVVAGHNVSFDKNFLASEYDRLGVSLPEVPLLCTCQYFGRNSLQACCDELGISFNGMPHRALSDARTTAQIVSLICSDEPSLLDSRRVKGTAWPAVPALNTPCVSRAHVQQIHNEPPQFLQRLSARIHHDVEAETPEVLAYMSLIDRVLEDRTIDRSEEDAIVDAASNLGLSTSQLEEAHAKYIQNLAVLAWADGVVTDSEYRDLQLVAKLLGQNESVVDSAIDFARSQITAARGRATEEGSGNQLSGQRVCFTGQLQSTIDGQPISREQAEAIATDVGLVVAKTVTKKLDLLVVADPNTQSGKATKARKYGVRVLADAVFWRMVGIDAD